VVLRNPVTMNPAGLAAQMAILKRAHHVDAIQLIFCGLCFLHRHP
jgi:hypothetical protein